MSDWQKYLTDDERRRLSEIEASRDDLSKERLRIYERAKKRKSRNQM